MVRVTVVQLGVLPMKLRFGDFELDTRDRWLQRAGVDVAIEPLAFDCIALLASRAGTLVRTAELRAQLWPDVWVSESAQRRVINAARRALGDDGDAQGFIRTRKRLGYVFVGAVACEHESSAAFAWPFVDRARELALLEQFVRADVGGLCLIHAEAGAGKSSLLARVPSLPGARGVWLTGHCHADPAQPAFWPFREIARQILARPELTPHLPGLLPITSRVSGVIPELAAGVRGKEPASEQARFEACEAWAEYLGALARKVPLRVVIEDAHWADVGSVWMLAALARAVRSSQLQVFVSYRSEALPAARSFSELLGRVSGRPGVLELALPGLGQAALEALLDAVGYPGALQRSAAQLLRLTGGNALFVRELVRHALSHGQALGAGMPVSLQQGVAERVRFLPGRSRQLLDEAAVLGASCDSSLLLTLSGVAGREALWRELEPALQAGLLRSDPSQPGQLAFSHALIREALLAGTSVLRKQTLHARALHALRAQPQAANLVALADHAFEAGDVIALDERRALCERAGHALLARLEPERAAQQLGRAVSMLSADDDSVDAAALELCFARACWHADRPEQEVGTALLSAAARARRAGAAGLLAQVALLYAVGDESLMDSRTLLLRPDALALAEEAWQALLREAGGAEDQLPRELAHRLARVLCWFRIEDHDGQSRARWAQLAERLAPDGLSPVGRSWLLAMRVATEPTPAPQALEQLTAHLRGPGFSVRERIEGLIMLMALHLSRADLAAYARDVRAIQDLAQPLADAVALGRLGERLSLYVLLPLMAEITERAIRGRLDEALLRLSAIPASSVGLGVAHARRSEMHRFVVGRWLGAYLGRNEGLEALLDAHVMLSPAMRFQGHAWKAQLALQRGDRDTAREQFARLRDSDFEPVISGYQLRARIVTLAEIADTCTQVGERADAQVLYRRLCPHGQRTLCDGVLISWGACSRVLGTLALQLERPREAEAHLQHALALNARLGHQPELVRTQAALARLYRCSGRLQEAESVRAEALARAASMSMRGFAFELRGGA